MPSIRTDSAWFFMSGKSWMEGLVPYRDFTDSKGPLLWLIYGLGYLISPHNLYGVFVFEVLFYWLNFYVLYKAARLFFKDDAHSVMASVSMSVLYFFPAMHFQMRIEDMCHLFQSTAFYILLRVFYKGQYRNLYGYLIGICLGCTLMLKYSYFLTLLLPSGALLIYFMVKGREPAVSPGRYLLYLAAGFVTVVLPFVIYFACVGALGDFIGEYFVNTGYTILNVKARFDGEAVDLMHRWPFKVVYLFHPDFLPPGFTPLVVLGFTLTEWMFRRCRWLTFTLFVWFVCSVLLFATVDGEGYYLTLSVFAFGGAMMGAGLFGRVGFSGAVIWSALVLGVLAIVTTHYIYSEFYYTERDRESHKTMQTISSIINSYEKEHGKRPTISFYGTDDKGEDILTNAIAGTRYWSLQAGMTDEMIRHHREDVFVDRPNFIVIKQDDKEYCEMAEANGYKLVYVYSPWPPVNTQKREIRGLYVDGS